MFFSKGLAGDFLGYSLKIIDIFRYNLNNNYNLLKIQIRKILKNTINRLKTKPRQKLKFSSKSCTSATRQYYPFVWQQLNDEFFNLCISIIIIYIVNIQCDVKSIYANILKIWYTERLYNKNLFSLQGIIYMFLDVLLYF